MMAIEMYILLLIAVFAIALYSMSFLLNTFIDILDNRMDVLSERIKILEDGQRRKLD